MSKTRTIFSIVLLISIISLCYLNFYRADIIISTEKRNDEVLIDPPTPRESGYKITSLWNYTTTDAIYSVDISKYGRYIAVGCLNNVTLFDRSTNETLWNIDVGSNVCSVAISELGNYIVAGNTDGNVTLFDNVASKTKTPIWSFNTTEEVNSVSISPDGEYIAAASKIGSLMGSVWLFNRSYYQGKPMWNFTTAANFYSLDISSDGVNYYIGAGGESTVGNPNLFLFNDSAAKYESAPMWSFENIGGGAEALSMDLNGFLMAVAFNNRFSLFNITDYQDYPMWKYELPIPTVGVSDIAISGDGEYIVAADHNRGAPSTVYFFNSSSDPQDLPKVEEWKYNITTPSNNYITSVAISYYGSYSLVGFYNGTVYLFNNTADDPKVPEWKNVADINSINDLAISQDARYLAVGNQYDLHLFHHAIPISQILRLLGGNDDDDDDEPDVIPFGNYYLIFLIIGVISLIILKKKKVFFSKN